MTLLFFHGVARAPVPPKRTHKAKTVYQNTLPEETKKHNIAFDLPLKWSFQTQWSESGSSQSKSTRVFTSSGVPIIYLLSTLPWNPPGAPSKKQIRAGPSQFSFSWTGGYLWRTQGPRKLLPAPGYQMVPLRLLLRPEGAIGFDLFQKGAQHVVSGEEGSPTRSSSREVRIRVPFFLYSILAGEPSPQNG